jgi:hypothetical protein
MERNAQLYVSIFRNVAPKFNEQLYRIAIDGPVEMQQLLRHHY